MNPFAMVVIAKETNAHPVGLNTTIGKIKKQNNIKVHL